MSQTEQPWMPGPDDLPWTFSLINPHGDRHLAFNDEEGRFYRLWQHQPPEPLHTGDAIILRPSDIDQIIRCSIIWITKNPGHPRCYDLSDEIAAGSKVLVLHYAKQAGAT
ncbi:MAG TPA: hypothetical protein VGL93_11035 [Streptosporangiaceae bacterium]